MVDNQHICEDFFRLTDKLMTKRLEPRFEAELHDKRESISIIKRGRLITNLVFRRPKQTRLLPGGLTTVIEDSKNLN